MSEQLQHHVIDGPRWREDRKPAAGLLMTASLRPPASAVARSDPSERLRDYLDALCFYLEQGDDVIDRILFVENTAAPLEPLLDFLSRHPHGKRVEIIGFNGNDHSPSRGKAYGEFKLMDFGLAHSRIFAADDWVWKTTGRLKLLNLAELQHAVVQRQPDLLCDLHNLPFIGSHNLAQRKHMDLRVFGFRRSTYDSVLRGLWESIQPTLDATELFKVMQAARTRYRVLRRFPLQPRLLGVSGRHLRDYQSDSQRRKDEVRALVRRVAPWLWL